MAALFKQTKAINPNQTTIMYWNSMLDFSMYKAHAKMVALEARGVHVYLRDKTGAVISLCNDGNVYCNITTFDWTKPAARQVWVEASIFNTPPHTHSLSLSHTHTHTHTHSHTHTHLTTHTHMHTHTCHMWLPTAPVPCAPWG